MVPTTTRRYIARIGDMNQHPSRCEVSLFISVVTRPFAPPPSREAVMATAPMDIPVTEESLMIVQWHNPVVDSVGYDVRSQHVELFWLNVLRPTSIAFIAIGD
jgi:hypothetical protein